MENLIEAKILKGFRDILPSKEIVRKSLVRKLEDVFSSFGYVPIDTPVLEYAEVLLRKSNGETEKQMFRFKDNGERDVALRFDLTVPFARFVAMHKDELYFPFKRYHIAKVFRGEKPQAGRYREFMQCDFDCVGVDNATSDFETLLMIYSSLKKLGITGIKIHINHRGVFNRFLQKLGVDSHKDEILRLVDKIAKIGNAAVLSELSTICENADSAGLILQYIAGADSFEKTLLLMENMAGGKQEDIQRLYDIYELLKAVGIQDYFVLDTSITRGLDYYTGVVFETFLTECKGIGSVCSGGRYDNLTGLYMKEKLSGVGASIGLDRLIAGANELGINFANSKKKAIMIFCPEDGMPMVSEELSCKLREVGLTVDMFLASKKMGQQYAIAQAKDIHYGILFSKENLAQGTFTLKNLDTRQTHILSEAAQVLPIINAQEAN